MKHVNRQSLFALALLTVPVAALAADAREEVIPRNAGVAVEPAHRAHVISNTSRKFAIDPSRIVWVVTEPAKTRVLLPAEEGAIIQARADDESVTSAAAGAAAHRGPDATVHFPFNSASVIDAAPVYSLVPRALAGQGVRLAGYTDQKGADQYNLGLSLRRANAVQALFVGAGVAAAQVQVDAHGEANPVSLDDDAKNRRVEITLVDGGAK